MSEVTQILSQIQSGDPSAASQLLPLVYNELRKLAQLRLAKERPGQTLSATSLVHEAYIRLVDGNVDPAWHGRGHFFAAAAEAMRRILVEQARRKNSLKAGGDLNRIEMADSHIVAPTPNVDLLILDEALDRLAAIDVRKAELVKLRFFTGLTLHEAAHVLNISDATADADWAYAKAWLKVEIGG